MFVHVIQITLEVLVNLKNVSIFLQIQQVFVQVMELVATLILVFAIQIILEPIVASLLALEKLLTIH
jgi:hypothetical protein